MKYKLLILLILLAGLLTAAAPLTEHPLAAGQYVEVYCKDGSLPRHLAEHGRVAVWCK